MGVYFPGFDTQSNLPPERTVEALRTAISDGPDHAVHYQSEPSNHWVIKHELNRRPSVMVTDSAGSQILTHIDYISDSELHSLTVAAFSGRAELS